MTLEKQLAQFELSFENHHHVILSEKVKPIIVPFVPNKLDLSDPSAMTKSNIQTAAKRVEKPGISFLPGGTFARIQLLQDRKWEATHPNRTLAEAEATAAIGEYERMQTLVRQFLNTEITRSVDGEAQLFSLALGKTALSDGQKVVLQLCVAIHAQGANLNNLIIFMDEPENHLHPAVLLDLVEVVRKQIQDGQLWISTHSIALLAEVDPSGIYCGRTKRRLDQGTFGGTTTVSSICERYARSGAP